MMGALALIGAGVLIIIAGRWLRRRDDAIGRAHEPDAGDPPSGDLGSFLGGDR